MSPRRRSSLNEFRDALHLAKVLTGDARAVQTGKIGQRVGNRIMGKVVGRAMRRLWLR